MGNEFVMVSRELAEEINAALTLSGYVSLPRGLQVAMANPAMHQGEPVAWQDPDNDSRMCTAEHKAYAISKGGAPAAALSTLTRPLYTHADPGEVERLREERDSFQRAGIKALEQLAERDALLRDALASHGVMLMTDPPQDPWKTRRISERIRETISASAEPSRSIKSECLLCKGTRHSPTDVAHSYGEPCPRCNLESFLKHNDRLSANAEPSAPEWDGKSWDVVYQREGKTLLSIRSDGVMDVYDRDGVKALMFDLINMECGAIVERDEQAEFESWYIRDVGIGLANLKRCNAGSRAYEDDDAMSAWEGWQARAALERKP